MGRTLQGVVGAGLLTAALVALAWGNVVPLAARMITPDVPFAAEVPPAAPDYADDAAWSALPGREDAADRAPAALPAGDQSRARVDVFYVHPTSYVGSRWNGPADDATLNPHSDDGGARIQASAFNACCAVYAPYYRQANGSAFFRPSADGALAFDLAYDDVRRAFRAFLARRGADRPFLVASHSQGTLLAERLLAEEVSGTPLRERLVAAWLVGGDVGAHGVAADLPPCRDADDLRCVVGWNARRPGFVRGEIDLVNRRGHPLLCTNPLTWRTDGAPAPAAANRGAVFLDSDDPAPRPGFASAQCEGGTLVVHEAGASPRDLPSRILDHVLGPGNLHPVEYQLYWADIRANADERVRAALAEGAAAAGEAAAEDPAAAGAAAAEDPAAAGAAAGGDPAAAGAAAAD